MAGARGKGALAWALDPAHFGGLQIPWDRVDGYGNPPGTWQAENQMALLDWSPALDLNVPAMDAEHKELVAAMNKIHELDARSADKPSVDQAIQKLVALTKKHFADEEKHMLAIGFPDLKRHALIHEDMLKKVGLHYQAFQGGTGRVDKSFFDFLVYWLGAHIRGVDKRYAEHKAPARV
jgi:hemerythrin